MTTGHVTCRREAYKVIFRALSGLWPCSHSEPPIALHCTALQQLCLWGTLRLPELRLEFEKQGQGILSRGPSLVITILTDETEPKSR